MKSKYGFFLHTIKQTGYFFISVSLFSLVLLNACKPEDPEEVLSLSLTSIGATAEANVYEVKVVTTADEYSATSDASWCVAMTDISKKLINIAVEKNNTKEIRRAKVTVKTLQKQAIISIAQAPDETTPEILTPTQRDSIALLALNNGNSKWNANESLEMWTGIKMETISGNRRVTEINLPGTNYITGILSDSIKNLSEVKYIDLTDCNLSGKVPSLHSLEKLVVLDLKKNQLTGAIPKLPINLAYLSLGQNKLSGSLPITMKELSGLQIMDLGLNDLTGEIPSEWSSLNKLKYFYLYGNLLTGSIPGYLPAFAHLEAIALDYNQLTGQIPTGIGLIKTLKYLYLYYNKLSGSIPSDLLTNTNWPVWSATVVPQQNGYTLSAVKSSSDSIKSIKVNVLPDNYMFYLFISRNS